MKHFLKISALALFVAVGAFAFASFNPSVAFAQDEEQAETTENQEEQQEENNEEQPAYNFTAQPGDSYTKIARKAVQIHGIVNNVNLSQAQIVAAETFLTSEAGFPELNVGESVTLSEDAVKAAVEKAEGLDENSEALWEKYVRYVDFNTDNVGEAR